MQALTQTLGKVLYIDDDPLNIRLIEKSLTHMGYEFHSALDSQTGLDTARYLKPDVILMDLHMPGIDGAEATEIIRADADLHHTLLMAVSANDRNSAEALMMESGCNAYLTKPISRSLLLKTVSEALQSVDRVL